MIKKMKIADVGRCDELIWAFGQNWTITGVSIESEAYAFGDVSTQFTVSLRGLNGSELELRAHGDFEVEVKVPDPWEGLKPGDVLAPRNNPKALLMFLGKSEVHDEPYLMSIDNSRQLNIPGEQFGYCHWSWYEKHYGSKLKPVKSAMWSTGETMGLNYYRAQLNLKELTDE